MQLTILTQNRSLYNTATLNSSLESQVEGLAIKRQKRVPVDPKLKFTTVQNVIQVMEALVTHKRHRRQHVKSDTAQLLLHVSSQSRASNWSNSSGRSKTFIVYTAGFIEASELRSVEGCAALG
jgi:hypothetical protein